MDMNLAHLVHGGQGRPRPPPLPLRRVLEVAADIAAGLALLHPTIVHRRVGAGGVEGACVCAWFRRVYTQGCCELGERAKACGACQVQQSSVF
jgi:hypothetical protein